MARRGMSKTERAARDAMKPHVANGLISQSEANKTIRDAFAVVEGAVRDNYSPDQAFYYAGKIAKAKEQLDAATGFVGQTLARGKLMGWEMYAAVYAVVREEHGDTDVTMEQAVETMAVVRDTAREMRSTAETFRAIANATELETPVEAVR